MIPSPDEKPLLTVDELLEAVPAWPGGRSATYEAVRRGELPSVRIGRRLFVPTAPLRRLLGLDALAVTRDEPSVDAEGSSVTDLPEAAKHRKRSPS
jgi:hypothetical protein